MRRRELIATIGSAALAYPVLAGAQGYKQLLIGWLGVGAPNALGVVKHLSAFRQGLSEMGFAEGRNVRFDYRWSQGHNDRLPALAASLVADKVDVIVAAGSLPQALAAKAATRTIPIVFLTGTDPVKQGLVTNLARPGGNLTGVAVQYIELSGKWVELLSEMVPKAKTVGLLMNSNYGASKRQEQFAVVWRKAANAKGLQLRVVKVANESDLRNAFDSLEQLQADALIVTPYFGALGLSKRIAALTVWYKVPTISSGRVFVASGGLMSYGPSPVGAWRKVGVYAGEILKGESPADLPVQQPTEFDLAINMNTARALGLVVPQHLLARATQLIRN